METRSLFEDAPPRRPAGRRPALMGALLTSLLMFPVVAAWSAVGCPIVVPFRGWVNGWEAVTLSFGTVLFLGIAAGGFPVLAIAGAIVGTLVQQQAGSQRFTWRRMIVACLITDFVLLIMVLLLAAMF